MESWIEWCLIQEGHEFLCEIDRSYIEDNFNLYGLRDEIPAFRQCLSIILDNADHSLDLKTETSLEQHAMDLYGLIHARYILTKRGMERMLQKYRVGEFGVCPCNECNGQPVLPVGLRDTLRYHEVMVYCPRCGQIFHPAQKQLNFRDDNLDGAYFGTTFAHLLLLQYPALKPTKAPRKTQYVPRIFGYKIHNSKGRGRRAIENKTSDTGGKAGDTDLQTQVEQLQDQNRKLKKRVKQLEAAAGGK